MRLWNSQAGSPCACPVVIHRHCSSRWVSGAHFTRGLPLVAALREAFGGVKLPFHPLAAGSSSSICTFVFSRSAEEAQVLGKVMAEWQLQMQKRTE